MNYGTIKNCDIANGTGVRVSLFVSGCRNHCPGCFQPETWDFGYGQPFTAETEKEVLRLLGPSYINGLTLLGGDPFEPENQRVLLPFLRKVKAAFLQSIFLGDAVRVIAKRVGVEVSMRMTAYTYNCLTRQYEKMTLGTVEDTVGASMISSRQLPSGIISGSKLALGSVGIGQLQEGSVGELQIQEAAIGNAHIQNAAISAANIQSAAIEFAHIAAATINSLNAGSIEAGAAKIAIGMEQAAFDRKAKELDERFRKADAKLNRLKAERQDRLMRVCSVKKYVENLRGQAGPIEVWNEQAWCLLVTQVTVHADGSAEFLFRGENRITVK